MLIANKAILLLIVDLFAMTFFFLWVSCCSLVSFFNRIFLDFIYLHYSTLLHLPPLDSTVSEDAGIEPRTIATLALTVRHSKPSDRSLPFLFAVVFHVPTKKVFPLVSCDAGDTDLFFRCCRCCFLFVS